jgi:hypothetical protein
MVRMRQITHTFWVSDPKDESSPSSENRCGVII